VDFVPIALLGIGLASSSSALSSAKRDNSLGVSQFRGGVGVTFPAGTCLGGSSMTTGQWPS
jgi:hypothetical protein